MGLGTDAAEAASLKHDGWMVDLQQINMHLSREERPADIGALLVANAEPTALMQQADGPLHH